MAIFNKNETENKLATEQETTPGLILLADDIQQSDYDSTDIQDLMKDYAQMRNEDAIASSSLEIITNTIENSKFTVVPGFIGDDEPSDIAIEAAEYIEWCYNNLYPSLNDYRHHKNLAWPFGFIMFEKIIERGVKYNGKTTNIIRRLSPIQHDTIFRYYYDKHQYFTGIQQYTRNNLGAEYPVDIEAERLYIFSPFSEFNNITGRSLLRPARRAWKLKTDIWNASSRAASRGAGIPVFTVGANASKAEIDSIKATIEKMGRTIGNAQNAYVTEQADKVTFRLEGLANQEHNVDLINFSNSEMFYNTLTHMVQSGIGQNGSRSATEEHKSPFLETVNYFIRLLDESEDKLIKDMIKNSYLYGKLDEKEYPKVKRERLKDADLDAMSNNILRLAQAQAIHITEKDEEHLRELFGLPELSMDEIKEENGEPKEKEEKPVEETPEEDTEDKEMKALKKGVIASENIEESREFLADITNRAGNQIDRIYNRLVENVAGQLAKNPDKAPKYRYKEEMIEAVSKLYNAAYQRGYTQTAREIGNLTNLQFANDVIEVSGDRERLSIKINTLYTRLKEAINETKTLVTPEQIANAGGIKQFIINRFKDGNKTIKSGIAGIPATGYTKGRNTNIEKLVKKNVNLEIILRYNASLENDPQNICEVCYPLHGLNFTATQATATGLSLGASAINPNCKGYLGGNSCRCQWEIVGTRAKEV